MRKIIVFMFLCFSMLTYSQSINEIFKSMPDELIPGLTAADRTMLLVDNKSNSIMYASGKIEKEEYSDTYLRLKTSDIGTLQLKLLPSNSHNKVICVIKTVCGKACDSQIEFYTQDWKHLSKSDFLPTIKKDLFLKDTIDAEEIYKINLLDISPISAAFLKNSDNLTLVLDYISYLSPENSAKFKTILKQEAITLHWNNNRFQ